jgi:alcohol dehydrogenase class IV
MVQFDARAKIVISDTLSDDVFALLQIEQVSNIALLVDKNVSETETVKSLKSSLEKKIKVNCIIISVIEPTTEMVNEYTNELRNNQPELLIGIGGGSTLDLVKAISVMAVHDGIVEDYHGTGKPFTDGIRKILIPTTAGTGSEVTAGAVLVNEKTKFKRGISGKYVTGDYAVLNPYITMSMPDNVTAATGMDALAHAVESYTAKCSNEITRMYSLKAFSLIYNSLPKVFHDKNNLEYRRNVLLGSCLAGFAIYNSNTGACHALSYPLGIYNRVPHGLAVATLFPEVVNINIEKNAYLYADLYDYIADGDCHKQPEEKSAAFVQLLTVYEPVNHLDKKFSDYGINDTNIDFLAERGLDLKSALTNNPVEFTIEDSKRVFHNVLKKT